jgi:hypothetical protein
MPSCAIHYHDCMSAGFCLLLNLLEVMSHDVLSTKGAIKASVFPVARHTAPNKLALHATHSQIAVA